jgi:hypothetical protein
VRLFIDKLREKRQTPVQQNQAAHAVSLYFEMQNQNKIPVADLNTRPNKTFIPRPQQVREKSPSWPLSILPKTNSSVVPPQRPPWRLWEDGYAVKSESPEWDAAIAELAAEIKTRHYSRKTLKTYAHWSRQFQRFLKDKPPKSLSSKDVKEYLTYLAVQCRVSASTQNQAFNSLLFLFRHALRKDFGDYRDVPRAKKSKYFPVVLSRKEIEAVLKHLQYPYDLVVKLLYGCGLMLFECQQLRVKDFNSDVRTTMICTHCIPSRTVKEAKSPLDF